MEPETSYDFETVEEFWDELEKTLSRECDSHDLIDEALRSYLALATNFRDEYIQTDDDLAFCAYRLYASPLFAQHPEYVRRQLIYCLLQDDDPDALRLVSTFLLSDAREDEKTFELLNHEGVFPRLVELIEHPQEHEEFTHRQMMELLYEMARIQKISNDDLTCVNDDFVRGLFDIIEQVSDDVNDPYHYPVIRVLLVLNEQFMVSAHDPAVLAQKSTPLTNKVMKVLSAFGSSYKTFGSNIILLLNREDETSLQLLTLKLMYLLFTTPLTYEYFYTNDVRVLVDILIRNLLDLPEYSTALRHTYLRVLYPLLEHTQLQYPPFYKQDEIRKLLSLLCGDKGTKDGDATGNILHWNHFEDVDDTTKRLVRRCQTVTWLIDPNEVNQVESPTNEKASGPDSPNSPTKSKAEPPAVPTSRKLRKRTLSKGSTLSTGQYLTPQLESARQSSLSMHEMAAQKEKPGVITPSRNPSLKYGLRQAIIAKKEKPPPPKARRSGFMRPKPQHGLTEAEVARTDMSEQMLEAEAYEPDESDSMSQTTKPDASGTEEKEDENTASQSKPVKKPPPAPKARRWGRKKKNEEEGERRTSKEPGKFSSKLPSITTTDVEQSPFSPSEEHHRTLFSPDTEKALSPVTESTASEHKGEKRSISAAMEEAQAKAVQEVGQCLENVHLEEKEDVDDQHIKELREKGSESPTSQQQQYQQRTTVLAPPGPTPIRGVPGPRIEIDRSPFLSDDEDEIIVEESEENEAAE